ncbi:hypothetical protein [Nonomuraea fuscirosea]|uniref:hypothetical protein n=1 Tax=Nonomuraea fuscirosea TaxID=1291556 RepID=UPI0033E667D6
MSGKLPTGGWTGGALSTAVSANATPAFAIISTPGPNQSTEHFRTEANENLAGMMTNFSGATTRLHGRQSSFLWAQELLICPALAGWYLFPASYQLHHRFRGRIEQHFVPFIWH